MKKAYFYIALAMTTGLAACSSDDGTTGEGVQQTTNNVVNLTASKATEINFMSNASSLEDEAVVAWETASTTAIDRSAEMTLCQTALSDFAANPSAYTTDFMYYAKDADLELEMYPLDFTSWRAQNHYLGLFYYNEEGQMVKQVVLNIGNPWNDFSSTAYVWNAEKGANDIIVTSKGVKITVKKGYKFGFYWFGNNTNNTVEYDFYTKADLNEALAADNGSGTSQVHAVTFNRDGKTYLATEDGTDFNYADLVFVFNKEVPTVAASETAPAVDPVTPPAEPEEPVVPEDPADPKVSANGGSVEVNLALNAEHENGDWKESHLSIHVRDTTDVTLFMPVPAEYYCPEDDMLIVQKHDVAYQYNTTTETTSMTINGNVVSMSVTYSVEGITLRTSGINESVLKYLREKYNDGITFEIRNYYNNLLDRAGLQALLNNSTMTFTAPTKTFVCAKGFVDGVEDVLACTVQPADIANRTVPTAGEESVHGQSMLYIYPLK